MENPSIIGRFAPTPSGPLHFGSLVTAVASYCHSKSQQGQWFLRIEDVDTPRVVRGADSQILNALEAFGFEWDGAVMYQSDQFERYQNAIISLLDRGLCYACECSRRTLREFGTRQGPMGQIYPGICTHKSLSPNNNSIRVNTLVDEDSSTGVIQFNDHIFGTTELNISDQVGDFVLRRVDGIYAYHLAVVIDDEQQGITDIVRGSDLLHSSCLHIFLQQRLNLRTPAYWHLPLVKNGRGEKLSKQGGAEAIDNNHASRTLISALHFLGQSVLPEMTSETPQNILKQAIHSWNTQQIIPH